MIQRVQSLYLFIAALLFGFISFLPLGVYHLSDGADALFKAEGLLINGATSYRLDLLQVMFIATALWIFSTIFYFKKRRVQMKLCITAFFITLINAAVIFFYWFKINSEITSTSSMVYLTAFFPFLSALLIFMAYKSIKKDDDLVKSVDRLR